MTQHMKYILLFSTAPNEAEAAKIAKVIVERRLVACVNIIPKVRSIYRWKGKVCDDGEAMLVMKSVQKNISAIKRELKKLHSYECPELIVLPITAGLQDYLKWIDENTL